MRTAWTCLNNIKSWGNKAIKVFKQATVTLQDTANSQQQETTYKATSTSMPASPSLGRLNLTNKALMSKAQ